MNSDVNLRSDNILRRKFSHIYIEDGVSELPECAAVLKHFPYSTVIPVHHYKDVFNRPRQDAALQYKSQNLILAANHGQLIYPGAKVCQDFGNRHFYYTSDIMNCLFNCEYCYLKGLYPTGNMVLFLNLPDIFREVESLLNQFPVYLCISYDTDLLALEPLTGFVRRWTEFALAHPDLTIEIRTKSGNLSPFKYFSPSGRSIFAWTLSPQEVIDKYEHGTASLGARIGGMKEALNRGFAVRAVFDPIIKTRGWKDLYSGLIDRFFQEFSPDDLFDASVGTFRISASYLKNMRRTMKDSAIVQYPFIIRDGVAEYEDAEETKQFVIDLLSGYLSKDRIFQWEPDKRADSPGS